MEVLALGLDEDGVFIQAGQGTAPIAVEATGDIEVLGAEHLRATILETVVPLPEPTSSCVGVGCQPECSSDGGTQVAQAIGGQRRLAQQGVMRLAGPRNLHVRQNTLDSWTLRGVSSRAERVSPSASRRAASTR